jgi:hypothetical protein
MIFRDLSLTSQVVIEDRKIKPKCAFAALSDPAPSMRDSHVTGSLVMNIDSLE